MVNFCHAKADMALTLKKGCARSSGSVREYTVVLTMVHQACQAHLKDSQCFPGSILRAL